MIDPFVVEVSLLVFGIALLVGGMLIRSTALAKASVVFNGISIAIGVGILLGVL